MKFVVAPDSYKGNLSAVEVAECIEKGIKKADESIIVKKIPVADGGEGTVEALVTATNGKTIIKKVHGPLMEEIDGFYGILDEGNTAVIEMAAAAGLALVPDEKKNPMETTTYGVGELILSAIEDGCKKIIIGIGGSSTNDGGMGMAQALGVKFFDKDNNLLGQGGKYLSSVYSIDTSKINPLLKDVEIVTACDVANPLYGPTGAAFVYAAQKGATPEMIEQLDMGLQNYSKVIEKCLNKDISKIPGSGAAGGLGGGLIAFLDASLKSGIQIVIETTKFEEIIKDADLLITGEGKTDAQTAFGKVPVGLSKVASKYNIPVICLSGGLGNGYEEIYDYGIDAAFSNVIDAMPLKEAIERSGDFLTKFAYGMTRLIKKIKQI